MKNTPLHAQPPFPHRGWHSRGYLPHLDVPGLIQSITIRLYDSIPVAVLDAWKSELALTGKEGASNPRCIELQQRIERYADQGHGACWLRDQRIAQLVQQTLLHFDSVRYCLLAWVVMPNHIHDHIHVLTELLPGYPLDGIIHSWKSFTAKKANKILERTGRFWMPGYFDRYIRDDRHFAAVLRYIEENPRQAGLTNDAGDWRWCSAFARLRAGRPRSQD